MEDSLWVSSNSSSMSSDIRELGKAMLRADEKFTATGLSGTVVHQKYKYAKINEIFNAVKPALRKEGIWIVQYDKRCGEYELLISRLIHVATGQWVEDERLLESEKPGNQAKGAAQTYMRKYAILALCGICAGDDDGYEEETHIEQKKSHPNNTQIKEKLNKAIINNPTTFKGQLFNSVCDEFGIEALDQMPLDKLDDALDYIKNWRPK